MSTSPDNIARIEWHAVRAWPAPVTQEAGGWLLRHTPGMKRLRASGVLTARSNVPACMATHLDFRRQGVGRAVLRGGAQWALDHGAANLYLQVEQANVAAQAVYSRAGFSHAYDYHYRVAPPPAHA